MHEFSHEEYPHGLRCSECHCLFVEGQPIAEDLDGFIEDIPVCVLICVDCSVAAAYA